MCICDYSQPISYFSHIYNIYLYLYTLYICKLNVLVCSLSRAVHGSEDEADLASTLSGILVGSISAG